MLISDEYRDIQQYFHESVPSYGVASIKLAGLVAQYINLFRVQEVLDYGAGKRRLEKGLENKISPDILIHAYDPCIPGIDTPPSPCEMVVCLDVLEHIEPECLDDVLDHIRELTKRVAMLTVHTGPAGKFLPDGRNAHLIQEPPKWWLNKIMDRFNLRIFQARPEGFYVIVK